MTSRPAEKARTVDDDPRPRARPGMQLIVALTVLITVFAAVVAIWMYWLAAALSGTPSS